jgi:hypothetical protein
VDRQNGPLSKGVAVNFVFGVLDADDDVDPPPRTGFEVVATLLRRRDMLLRRLDNDSCGMLGKWIGKAKAQSTLNDKQVRRQNTTSVRMFWNS